MVISAQLLEQVLSHLRSHFPDEACGILAAQDGVITKVYPITNVSESPVVYSMDSGEQLQAFLDMDEQGWDLGAIFHSHTRTRAYPSRTDIELAFYPEALQIIISLADRERPDVRAFRIQAGQVLEEKLEIT